MNLPQLLDDALTGRDWAKVGEAYTLLTGSTHAFPAESPSEKAPLANAAKKAPAKKTPRPKKTPKEADFEPLADQQELPFESAGDTLDEFRVAGVAAKKAKVSAAVFRNTFNPVLYESVEPPVKEELGKKPTPRDRRPAPEPKTVTCERCHKPFEAHAGDFVRVGEGRSNDPDDEREIVCGRCCPTF